MYPISNESKIFNYSDVFFSYFLNNDKLCTQMIKEHSLTYIYSGELLVDDNGKQIVVKAGECVFLRRDNRLSITKQPVGGKQYAGIFMKFKRNLLREVFQQTNQREIPKITKRPALNVMKMPARPDIASLFQSMVPYFDTTVRPTEELVQLKIREGVNILLDINPEFFYPCLFDFSEPWKIDILEYLNENYMYDLSLEEIASFTGRSLSAFKRDFQKISEMPPQKWLMQKRLEAAHDMLKQNNKKVSEVYTEVGFKNLSHFSQAFKKYFGITPSTFTV